MRNSNGTGSVIKLGGKRRRPYAVRVTSGWTDDGKQIFKYLSYHEKKTEAKRALDVFNVNPYDLNADKITFEDIYKQWSEKAFTELSKSSVDGYRSSFKHTKRLHKIPFRTLKAKPLQDVIDAIESPSMAKMTKFLFQKLYKFAMENDIVEKDYSKFVKPAKSKETAKEKNPMSKNDIQILWNSIGEVEYVDLTIVLLYTGMRIGELLEMKKENVHLEKRYMIGGNKTESGKERIIPLHNRIIPLIKNRLEQSPSEYLFTTSKGKMINYKTFVMRKWNVITDLIENKGTPHITRHTFISNLDRLNVNRTTIQRLVGHSNKEVTDVYIHKTLDELIKAVDLLD